jgi:hypothetical protein
MAKPIITANEVFKARQEGRAEIAVPPGAIVTPQARDDAGKFGIRLVVPASGPCVAAAAAPVAPACAALPKPADVPGRITLYAGKPFME